MRSLWAKIGLGAVGVFGVGMLLITVAREAKSAVKSALNDAFQNTVQGAALASAPKEMPFRLDGTDLGLIRRLAITRQAKGDLPDVNLEVSLPDAGSAGRIRACDLVPAKGRDFSFERGFRCSRPGESGMISVGEAVFTPGDFVRPLKVERNMESSLREGDPFQATAEMGGDVRVVARDADGSMVHVQADSTGARINVNDAMGRALVRLLADSNGAALRIRAKDGRDVVRLEAGQGGFSITVDTSAAH